LFLFSLKYFCYFLVFSFLLYYNRFITQNIYLVVMYTLTIYVFRHVWLLLVRTTPLCSNPDSATFWASACKRSIRCFSSCHRSLIKQMPFYRLCTLVAFFFIFIVNQLVLAVDKSALKTEDNHDNAIEYTFINVIYSGCILGQSRISILIIS
jgi:hypothetical protein